MWLGVNCSLNPQCRPCTCTPLYPYISCCTRVQQRCVYWDLNMTYRPTQWCGAATPMILGQVLNDAKVGCNKHMQAMIHTCLASFRIGVTYLSTFENCHGEIARELLCQPRTGQRDLCGRILGIVIAHDIMNKATRKYISTILLAHHNI